MIVWSKACQWHGMLCHNPRSGVYLTRVIILIMMMRGRKRRKRRETVHKEVIEPQRARVLSCILIWVGKMFKIHQFSSLSSKKQGFKVFFPTKITLKQISMWLAAGNYRLYSWDVIFRWIRMWYHIKSLEGSHVEEDVSKILLLIFHGTHECS